LSSIATGLVVGTLIALGPAAEAATLSVSINGIFGSPSARVWPIDITNSNAFGLTDAEITTFSLTQQTGPAGTPVIVTSLPILLGTIPANSAVTFDVTIDFTGLSDASLFAANATLIGDGFTGSLSFTDVQVFQDCNTNFSPSCISIPGTASLSLTSTPLPPSSVLFGGALLILGMMRRKFRKS
jgi:hypothetical protein